MCYNGIGDTMKSIKKDTNIELEINKSIFYDYLIKVDSVDDANQELEKLRKKYPDANHHCFCYIIGENQEIQKYSDDGEPSKTAGMPMIEVLKKHDLTNVLNVSVRYFGGIKLGAGGLVRAYTKSCAMAVKEAEFSYLNTLYEVEVKISFDLIGVVEKYIRDNHLLLDTIYKNDVSYIIEILSQDYDRISDTLSEKTKGSASVSILKTYKKYI